MSRQMPASTLLLIFAVISTLAAVMMFIPRKEVDAEVAADEVTFNRPLAIVIAAGVGVIGGLVGAAGGFTRWL